MRKAAAISKNKFCVLKHSPFSTIHQRKLTRRSWYRLIDAGGGASDRNNKEGREEDAGVL
jgi:hypothetical protein